MTVARSPGVRVNTDPIVQDHLRSVARRLATRTVPASLAARRECALRRLAEYADAGVFPENRVGIRHRKTPMDAGFLQADGPRAPIFVDPSGVHCAVAHVVAGTNPALVARIAGRFNEAWVPDMATDELADWAEANGLSLRELAEIQPSYQVWIPNCTEDPAATWAVEEAGSDGDVAVSEGDPWACFDTCAGDLLLRYPLWNPGSTAITDVRVEVEWWVRDEPSDAVPPLVVEGLTVEPMMGIVVGPFAVDQDHVGDLVERADVRVTATVDGDPDASNNTADGWAPSMVTHPIVATDCPDLSWGPNTNEFDNRPCGCAETDPTATAALASLAALAARRRVSRRTRSR